LPLHPRSTRPPPVRRAGLTLVASPELSSPVEIISPDPYCAALLLEAAGKLFSAEILPGSGCVVRLQPPPGGDWVLEVIALVEGWLDSIPLPCTKVFYGERSYLIRGSSGVARAVNAS
jgi:hypothetical protein